MTAISILAVSPLRGQDLTPQEIAAATRDAVVGLVTYGADGLPLGSGSGFFIDDRGTLITNYHVLEEATTVRVEVASGETFEQVLVLVLDERRDLAVLRIPNPRSHHLQLADDRETEVGTPVYAMGNPLGLDRTFSDGLLSGRRVLDGVSLLQITAPVSPGSSGGPVLNSSGQAIAVAMGSLGEGQNLNLAVPTRYASALLELSPPARPFSSDLVATSPSSHQEEGDGRNATPLSNRVIRSVDTPAGLYTASATGSESGGDTEARLALVPAQGEWAMVGWLQRFPGSSGVQTVQLVNQLVTLYPDGRIIGVVDGPLAGGFLSDSVIVLQPQGTPLSSPVEAPGLELNRIPAASQPFQRSGFFYLTGHGGKTNTTLTDEWTGVAVLISSAGSVNNVQNEAILALSLQAADGTTTAGLLVGSFTDTASADFPEQPFGDRTKFSAGTLLSGRQLSIYIKYNISGARDYEIELSGPIAAGIGN